LELPLHPLGLSFLLARKEVLKMAKYDATKFYWLQLREDFFDEDAIDWLEEQPNGKEYSLFYLKLCLKSLRTNGVLIRRVGNMLVPYDHVKLGELTKTPSDTVMVAMQLLLKIGLVKTLENGELYVTQVENMIGSQSKSAFKKQQQRLNAKSKLLLGGGHEEDTCPPNIEKEIEQEQELELEKEKEKKQDKTEATPLPAKAGEVGQVLTFEEQAFNEFWKAYPKKVNKKGCFTSFKRIKHLKDEMPLIMAALQNFKASKQWQKDNGQYIPNPQTFINQERWKDQQEQTREQQLNNINMDGWV